MPGLDPRGQAGRPGELGLIASLGIAEVAVSPPPARRLLLDRRRTGVDRHAAGPGQIYDANRYTCTAC